MFSLTGKEALVVGVANEGSIAWGCARAPRRMGAEVAITSLNAHAESHVRPLAASLDAPTIMPRDKAVEHYNSMGPVKVALESVARYTGAELGPKGISVNTLSSGPPRTRGASGVADFDALLDRTAERASMHQRATLDDVGAYAAFLASDQARHVTGRVHRVDGGYGNCQGGWATLLLGATNPDLTGPLMVNGAPVDAWAGEIGKGPMRYNGGMIGGAWPADHLSRP